MSSLPFSARLYFVALTSAVVCLMMALLIQSAPFDRSMLAQVTVAAALLTLAWLYPLSLSFKRRLYLDTSVLVASIVLFPPGLVMVVAGAGTLLAHLIQRQIWVQTIFNSSQMMTQAAVGGLILASFDGRLPLRPEAVGYVVLAAGAMYIINNLLVVNMIALQSSKPLFPLLRHAVVNAGSVELIGYLIQVGAGILAVYVIETFPWMLPLLMLPTVFIFVVLQREIQNRQKAEAARHEGDAAPAEVQRVALLGTWQWNLSTGDSTWSDEIYEILGLDRDASHPSYESLLRSVHPDDRLIVNRAVHDALRSGEPFYVNHRILLRDGTERILEQRGRTSPATEDGESRLTGTIQDVTERKTLEAQLARQAFYDPVTNLPNRAFALDHLAELLAGRRSDQKLLAVVLVHIDGFEYQESRLAADEEVFLVEVTRRLHASFRDSELIARFGIKRFLVILEVSTVDAAATFAASARNHLRVPIDLQGRHAVLDVTVGTAVSSPDVQLPQHLVSAAEADLARQRAMAYDTPAGFVAERDGAYVLENELRNAIDQDELQLLYQPEVILATGEVAGFEALIRWRPSSGVWLAPADFLAVAETSGLIISIGRWALEEACRAAHTWRALTARAHPLTVSVNVSGEQIRDRGFVEDVARVLDQTGLEPELLRLEVTELAVVQAPAITSRTLDAMREIGVRFTIDNFGAGYASLGSLHRLPIDSLKLDPSLTAGLEKGDVDRAIVHATASLAGAFGLQVAVKNLETPLQLAWASALGCDRGQGYFFLPPLERDQLTTFITGPVSFDGFSAATLVGAAKSASYGRGAKFSQEVAEHSSLPLLSA